MGTAKKKEHVAVGSPVPSGPENENKHKDTSQKPAEKLDEETKEEFESHNMSDHRGYNETNKDVPVEYTNIAKETE